MKFLDLTLSTPAANLAVEEALLNEAEDRAEPTELLRLWESPTPVVVVGRASKVAQEVNVVRCGQLGVPVLRRCSGGTAVLAGPGCLMYAVILNYDFRPQLRIVEQAHRHVISRMREALSSLDPSVEAKGSSDLAIGNRKISGNSLRCKRRHLLYHGTVLYDFPLEKIQDCLGTPPREPAYRAGRDHSAFLANLPHSADRIRQAIRNAWDANEPSEIWPQAATEQLVEEQYSKNSWNMRL